MIRQLTTLAAALALLPAVAKNPIPSDPAVRVDTLPNGLTYYLMNNDDPEHQADFFIAQRVGSLNEEDNQRGLAHFLEHLCFNGTEHFPGNSLISYLETLGVKFGANLNAYTSTDETVYNICEVPTQRVSALDSCLLILRDWSCGLLLTDKDIDNERGVIKGEWRQRQGNPANRMLEKGAPDIYKGSRYAHRMPIGSMEVIENFPHQVLRDYYHKWYRPENQAVIVVGDIDVDRTEAKIKELFGSIPRSEVSMRSPRQVVPDNKEIIASVQRDPEQQVPQVQLYVKHPDLPDADKRTIDGLRERYMADVAGAMLAERFDGIENDPDSPFSNLGTGDTKFILARDPRAWVVRAQAKTGRENDCVKVFATELKRAARYGFLNTELERARLDYRSELDSRFANRDKISNTVYARRFANHFTGGGSIPSEEAYYKMMKGVLASVKLDDVNKWFANLIHEDNSNVVILAYLPADTKDVTTESLGNAYKVVDATTLEPYTDMTVTAPLLASEPVRGKIVKESRLDSYKTDVWTLSNGIKVYARHNDDSPDQVVIQAFSPGGLSQVYDPAEAANYLVIDDVAAISAFGGHTSSDLRKQLVGKKANVQIQIKEMEDIMAVNTTPKDLGTALQVMYLKATAPGRDDKAFNSFIDNKRMKLKSTATNPTFEMGDSIHANVYNHHPLGSKLQLSDIDKINYDRILEIIRGRFADMSDFSFFITGNFDTDSLRDLTERYIASLPGSGNREKPRDVGYRYTPGHVYKVFNRKMETPSSIVYSLYTGPGEYDLQSVLKAKVLGQVLQTKLLEDIREDKGWTYGVRTHVGINAAMNGDDGPQFLMPVYIKVEPGRELDCLEVVRKTVENLKTPGFITEEETAKARNYLLKTSADADKDNAYWASVLHAYDKFGKDLHSGMQSAIKAIDAASLTDYAEKLFTGNNLTELIMKPEN